MDQTLITNVHIVDGASPAAFPGEVLVAGNRIQAVAEGSQRLPREGASVLNGQGAYLMPGLVESHVHIGLNDTDDIVGLGFLPPEEHTLLA
ncbi:MAG: amidohydrolase family protein, partial [Acidobacteria bacterium]|nr:amidohydrolase family protein [Acidobacteriota bacterium]